MKKTLLIGMGLSFCALVTDPAAKGCAALSSLGPVGINNEAAVIIWDKANHTEHFIRSAIINSTLGNVGFLVPTPTTPELALADKRIFELAEKYVPPPPPTRDLTDSAPAAKTIAYNGTEPVIVNEQDIGDYHAVTLDASDPDALGGWLKTNGYAWTTGSAKWLAPYLKAKWKITAFKLKGASTGEISTNAIRMSFTTDRPFFPYSEPAEASKLGGAERTLQLAILSDKRMTGKLGDETVWPAYLSFAGSTTPPAYAHVNKGDWLKYAKLNNKSGIILPLKLTYFLDISNPRHGKSDLFFSASPDQSDYPSKP